jgi:hypothetical protein
MTATCPCRYCEHNATAQCDCPVCVWIRTQWTDAEMRANGHTPAEAP